MKPNIKITAKQIRFVFDSGKVWMIQSLHASEGIPVDLRGYYRVPLEEQRKHAWGWQDGKDEKAILRSWVSRGFKL